MFKKHKPPLRLFIWKRNYQKISEFRSLPAKQELKLVVNRKSNSFLW